MIQTLLSRAVRRIFAGGGAVGLALLAAPSSLLAQEAPPPPAQAAPIARVEITGSSIRRLAAESSLPITTVRAADFAKQGLSTAQEVLNSIPMNQSSEVGASAVGAAPAGVPPPTCAAWAATRPWCCSMGAGWRTTPISPTPSTSTSSRWPRSSASRCCATAPRPSTAPTPSAA